MRKLYAPAVLGLVITGGAAWVAARQPWTVTVIGAGKLPGSTIQTSGADAFAALPALGLVILAAGLGVLASSGWIRRVVGALVMVVGSGGLALAAAAIQHGIAEARNEYLATSPAWSGDIVGTRINWTLWPWLATGAFALAIALGLLATLCARIWPTMSARYDAPRRGVSGDEPADLWKALDDGQDPTQ
jgi:uncharacterized membrane protein (TIGR02234 family)